MVYDPSKKSFTIGLLTHSAQSEVQRYAEASADRAMWDGDFTKALAFLEIAFEAERLTAQTTQGLPAKHVKTPNRQHSVISAILDRPDLIDHAIDMLDLRIEDLRKPFEPTSPGILFHGETIEDATEYTPTMQIAHHDRSVEGWISSDLERRQYTLDHKSDIPLYKKIRASIKKNPGIRQVDLTKYLPGLENKQVARMVDQLEAAGLLVTGTVGNRVQVWTAGHPDAPGQKARRAPRWEFGSNPFYDQDAKSSMSDALRDPEATLRNAQGFAALVDSASQDSKADALLKPTVQDFMDRQSMTPAEIGGLIVHFDTMQRSMAIWGHIDFAEALRILRHYLEFHENLDRRSQATWLSTTPRHTYVERQAHTCASRDGSTRSVFVLREAVEPTKYTVPVTAVCLPRNLTAEEAAQGGGILWLPQKSMPRKSR